MIDTLFVDTDCISAFLWVNEESLIEKLYSGKIVIPKEVYDELSYPSVSRMKKRIDILVDNGVVRILDLDISDTEYELYLKMTGRRSSKMLVIGNGEASAIALTKKHNGILASNNLKDIQIYIERFSLRHMTTGDILLEAYEQGFITEEQGNTIWANMLAKRRQLGTTSFTEYKEKKFK